MKLEEFRESYDILEYIYTFRVYIIFVAICNVTHYCPGMNALFGLKTKLSISDRTIVATATATAAYISALPPPTRPRIIMTTSTNKANNQTDQQYLQRYKT